MHFNLTLVNVDIKHHILLFKINILDMLYILVFNNRSIGSENIDSSVERSELLFFFISSLFNACLIITMAHMVPWKSTFLSLTTINGSANIMRTIEWLSACGFKSSYWSVKYLNVLSVE